MRERIVAGGLNAGGTLIITLLAIARTKLFALVLGVSGVGVVSQVLAVQSAILSVSPLFSGPPLLAALAIARRGSGREYSTTLAAARGLGLAAVGVPAIAVAAIALMQGNELTTLVAIGTIGIPFGALLSVEQTALQEAQRFPRLVLSNVAGTIVGLAVVAMLTLRSGIEGATIGITVAMVIGWITTYAVALQRTPLAVVATGRWLAIGRVGTAALLASVLGVVGFAALRPVALATVGALGAGIVYALMGLSLQLSVLVATALATYASPRVAAAAASGDHAAIRDEIATIQVLGLVGASLGFVLLAAIAGPVVSLLLSDAFGPVAVLLPLQLAGELFLIHAWLTGIYLVPLRHRRILVAIPAVTAGSRIAFAVALVPAIGVAAFPLAHLLASTIAAMMVTYHARRVIGLGSGRSLVLLCLGATGTLLVPIAPVASVAAAIGLVVFGSASGVWRRLPQVGLSLRGRR